MVGGGRHYINPNTTLYVPAFVTPTLPYVIIYDNASCFFPILEKSESTSEEIIATFTEHVAVQLSENIQHYSSQKVLVTGGGAFNTYLIELLQQKTKAQIILPQKNLIEVKEARMCGFLGVLRLENEINVLASVTGASKNHSSGKIFEV